MPYHTLLPVNFSAPGIIQKKAGIENAIPNTKPEIKVCFRVLPAMEIRSGIKQTHANKKFILVTARKVRMPEMMTANDDRKKFLCIDKTMYS